MGKKESSSYKNPEMPNIADIEAEARALVDADTTSYPAATLLRRENSAYEEIVGLIIGCDGLWQFDDTNYSDFPIGVTTLVNSQNDYTFDVTHLEIERVEVLDEGGIWHKLAPIDISQIGGAISEFMKEDGRPQYYDKQGSSIVLYPAPDNGVSVTLASGLKVYFQRTADIFTSAEQTTGTKVPGFASPYHYLISYKAALPYALSYKGQRVPMILSEINRLEKGLKEHYSRREKDRRKVMKPAGISHR
jgi:hypothetical protein